MWNSVQNICEFYSSKLKFKIYVFSLQLQNAQINKLEKRKPFFMDTNTIITDVTNEKKSIGILSFKLFLHSNGNI